ncbi:hypothetical protein SY83_19135 [Paenibacillus swuensis]|uniref:histidine kinase n=2 Tax=Paenibacillus swuensis TaxID=1178515 RepID=A0A172TPR7_9BACL|nr:hypothetical protein SY83_19135 [Paenibacillus swuensis]
MSAALLYLVITPTRLYTGNRRKMLFVAILTVLSYFYLFYEHIDPDIYILHLIPVSLGFAVLFEGAIPGICTWFAFNIGSYFFLHNEIAPVVAASSCMLLLGLYAHKRFLEGTLTRKIAISMVLLFAYMFVLLSMKPSLMQHSLFIITCLIGSIFSTWLTHYLYFNVKRQEIVKEKLINAEKYQLIGQLAASMSHEIRNPLTISRGFLQIMRKPSLTSEDLEKYIHFAIDGIDQSNAIITDYLNFAKPHVGKIEPIDINEEIKAVMPFITSLALLSNVDIQILPSDENPLIIMGESKKMRQCLLNLTKNGIEAMPDGGSLTIQTLRSQVGVEIIIKDTGVGMRKEQLRSAGLPFYTTKEKGTGLGLMVVNSLLKSMNGRIYFESKPNKGTRCQIVFKDNGKSMKVSGTV